MGVSRKTDKLEFYPQDLHLTIWENTSDSSGVIAAIHGLNSHGERNFHYFGPYMAERGWTTLAVDMPGFGHWTPQETKGEKQHWDLGFTAIAALLTKSRLYSPNNKIVLLGSSIGSLLCLNYMLTKTGNETLPDCVILSAIPLKLQISFYIYPILGMLALIVPDLKLRLDKFDSKVRSSDPNSIINQLDALKLTRLSVGYALKAYKTMRKVRVRNNPMQKWPREIPVFFQTGGQDAMIDLEVIREFYDAIPSEVIKQHHYYENAHHYLFHEDIRKTIFDNIHSFLCEHL